MAGKLIVCEIGTKVPKEETEAWKYLLSHWCAVLNGYFVRMKREKEDDYYDLPHWHNERAQVGFLAAAVWRMGGVALEEYRTSRTLDEGSEATIDDTTPGRCDLYFNVDSLDYVVEAKLYWMTSDSASNKNAVIGKIKEAHKQLSRLDKKDREDSSGLAMCWGVATTSAGTDRGDEAFLRRFADNLKRSDRVIGVYYMPSKPRAKVEETYGDDEEYYPGVVFVGEYHNWK